MTPEAITRAAHLFAAARKAGRPMALAAYPADLMPQSPAEAYAVQDATRGLLAEPVAGWKIGATAPAIMAKFGMGEPFFGPIYAGDVVTSPARMSAGRFAVRGIETELVLRLGRNLAVRAEPWSRAELIEAVDAVMPGFEIISPRFDRLPDRPMLTVADCGVNGGLVVGRAIEDWRRLDLIGNAGRLTIDGQAKANGTGADAMGDPIKVLEWIANRLRTSGIGLTRGQLLSTGTMTGLVHLEPGQRAVGDLGALGRVELVFE